MWDDILELASVAPLMTLAGIIAYAIANGLWALIPMAIGGFVLFVLAGALVAMAATAVKYAVQDVYSYFFGSEQP